MKRYHYESMTPYEFSDGTKGYLMWYYWGGKKRGGMLENKFAESREELYQFAASVRMLDVPDWDY